MDILIPVVLATNFLLTIYYGMANPHLVNSLIGGISLFQKNHTLGSIFIAQLETLFLMAILHYLGDGSLVLSYVALWVLFKLYPIAKERVMVVLTAYSGLASLGTLALLTLTIQTNFVAA